jgi:hypothetical protein
MAKLGAEPEPLIKAKMRPYCSPLPEPEYARLSVQQLVNNNICPPWYSTCLSSFTSVVDPYPHPDQDPHHFGNLDPHPHQ